MSKARGVASGSRGPLRAASLQRGAIGIRLSGAATPPEARAASPGWGFARARRYRRRPGARHELGCDAPPLALAFHPLGATGAGPEPHTSSDATPLAGICHAPTCRASHRLGAWERGAIASGSRGPLRLRRRGRLHPDEASLRAGATGPGAGAPHELGCDAPRWILRASAHPIAAERRHGVPRTRSAA